MVIAVFLPEVVYTPTLITGVREIRVGETTGLENGNWEYTVLYTWVFSLFFGAAFELGAIGRAGFITVMNTGTGWQTSGMWVAIAMCVAGEVAHWVGYLGIDTWQRCETTRVLKRQKSGAPSPK
jgi:hypothetical protein